MKSGRNKKRWAKHEACGLGGKCGAEQKGQRFGGAAFCANLDVKHLQAWPEMNVVCHEDVLGHDGINRSKPGGVDKGKQTGRTAAIPQPDKITSDRDISCAFQIQ